MYSIEYISPSTSTFCVTLHELSLGMGVEFESILYDGFAKNGKAAESAAITTNIGDTKSNSFQILKYVTCALYILSETVGVFPFQFDRVLVDDHWERTDASLKAYSLITKAAYNLDLDCNSTVPSLWCIWSFINVFYWQLMEMLHPESPLNGCCIVDNQREDVSLEQKIGIKGKIK